MSTNLENLQWSQDWKISIFIPIPKKDNAKECSSSCAIVLISHASKVILNILQARLQQFVNWELPAVVTGFRKGRATRDQIDNIPWIIEKARGFQKKKICFLDYAKPFDCVDHNRLWKILREMGVSEYLICFFRKLHMKVKKQQLEMDMEEWIGSKLGEEYVKAVYYHSSCLTLHAKYIMWNAGRMKHQLELRLPGEISITSDYADDTTLMAESEEELKSLLMKVKKESERVGLKLNIQKMKIMASGPITSWEMGK